MLTLTFHVCVKLKRNLHRNKFGNCLGVQQEPPFTSTSQSTVHRATQRHSFPKVTQQIHNKDWTEDVPSHGERE